VATQGRTWRWIAPAILVGVFLAATVALHGSVIGRDQYDDSYITYRYAANLATGKGLVFNSYERINSASSFLYTIVLAAAYSIGLHDLELFASLFGLAAGSILVVMTFLMARRQIGGPVRAFAVTFPLCIAGSIGGWAVSGMETIFFAALVATFLYLYLFVTPPGRAVFALLGLVALCRVEGVILVGLVAVREVVVARDDRSKRHPRLFWFGALALAPLAALTVFDRVYYGSIVPHSVYLKQVSRHYSPGIGAQSAAFARFYVGYYLGFVLLAGAAMYAAARAFRRRPRTARSSVSFLAAYVLLSAASLVAAPFSDAQRYSVHLLPILAVLALGGWGSLSRRFFPPAARAFADLAIGVVLIVGPARDGLDAATELRIGASHQAARREIGSWLMRHTPPSAVIASTDLGEIAYYALSRDFVDLFGLTSAGFAELSQAQPDLIPALFAQRRPTYFADTGQRSTPPNADDPSRLLTRSELILADPSSTFRNVPPHRRAPLRMPYARTPVVSLSAGGRIFMVVAIDWSL
jgi:nitrate reductase gamma subunit